MSRTADAGGNYPHLYSFRLSHEDADVWDAKIARSGMKISEFMREAVINNETVIVGQKRMVKHIASDPDMHRRNFLLAASSRNLNQIAHRLNSDNLVGLVTPATYASILDELLTISVTIKKAF
ncbi:plasmid mobilization protein [Polaromonas hydrogenivorans]|uniref:Plasmid mobilization relaxosome protein MobC n=1 Tax=Polaromonas hydrogenivorans TaxID=335476 RepID=A0AAU7LZY3_9BURK